MAAVIPKGFEIVADEDLPNAPGLEGWQTGSEAPEYNVPIDPETGGPRELIVGGMEEPPEGFEPLPEDPDYIAVTGTDLMDETQADQQAQDDYTLPRVGGLTAARRGLTAGTMFGLDDEFAAGAGTLANKLAQIIGVNDTTASMGEVYRQLLQRERDEKDAAYDQHPYAYGAGFVPGALLSAPFIGGRVAQGETALGTVGNLMGAGARAGAVSGAGNNEGDLTDLAGNTIQGALGGAVAAPLVAGASRYTVEPLVQKAAQIVGRVRGGEGVMGNAMNSGLEQLARRSEQDPAAMRAAAEEMTRAGVPPRPVDLVNEEGRGVMRVAANQLTPAREDLRRHAQGVYADMQDRVATQARENISQAPQTARQLSHQIDEDLRAQGPQFDAVRDLPVEITPEIRRALDTAEGRGALRKAARLMAPEDAQVVTDVIQALGRARRVGTIEDQARAAVPGFDRMSPAAQQQIIAQGGFEDPMAGAALTVDAVDRFREIMGKVAAENGGSLGRSARRYADTVAGAARRQYPAYDQALNERAAMRGVQNAAEGTKRFENSQFLKTPPDEFVRTLQQASREGPPAAPRFTPEERAAYIRAYQDGYAELPDGRTIHSGQFGSELPEPPMAPGFGTDGDGLAERINFALREGRPLPPEAQRMYDAIIEEFQMTPPSQAAQKVQRLIGIPEGGRFVPESRQLSSTTTNPDTMVLDEFIDIPDARGEIMDITVPAGERTIRTGDSAAWGDEGEVLLPPGRFSSTGQATPHPDEDFANVVTQPYEFSGNVPPRPQGISEADALRIRARDEVVDAATQGAGSAAPGVARQLSRGRAQRQRNEALLGPESAGRLERGMGAELRRYENTQDIDPRAGSKTASVGGDEAAVAGDLASAAFDVKTGGFWGAVRGVSRFFRERGVRGVNAERLVRDAISEDPNRVRQVINYLERRGMERARARGLVRSINANLGGRVGGALSYDGPPEGSGQARAPVPSVRSVMNADGRVDKVKGEQ